jgi:Roadblock/LC7 domain
MRTIEPWVEAPLQAFLTESSARLTLLMTSSGQVVAQHGFGRSLDVMTAAALGAGIVASTEELARLMGAARFEALVHHGAGQSCMLAAFTTPRGRWIALVVFGRETSVGIVQLFFDQMVQQLTDAAPREQPVAPKLAEDFERELDASLRALFGR